ncbi:AMP-binding protein [Pseudidiomarina sp.]|uniref:AMP-binding protein n=1 Tax=Pseudidiomarina sp. TaxID=2081707 RepID=UPI003A96F676
MWLKSDTTNWLLVLPQTAPWQGFHADIHAARNWLQSQSAQRWLLFERDSYRCAVWLFALLAEDRQPVMPQNQQQETLRLVAEVIDAKLPEQLPERLTASDVKPLRGPLTTPLTLFTSGSSGTPQAIQKSARQLFNEVHTLETTFGDRVGDAKVVTTISHQHIYGLLFTLLWPICTGRCLVPQRLEYLEQWQRYHQQADAYLLVSSPAHLDRFTELTHLHERNDTLRAVFSSGGPLATDVPQRFRDAGLPAPIEVYGSTETGGIGWRQRNNGEQAFQRFNGIELTVDSDNLLRVQSPHLPDAQVYTTADKVELLNTTEFKVLGRADRIVKIAENRVSLAELEQFCETLPWVRQAKCVQLYQPRSALGLVVVLTTNGQRLLGDEGRLSLRRRLREHLQQRFDKVVLPRKFRYVEALPCNSSGKTTCAMLQELFTTTDVESDV